MKKTVSIILIICLILCVFSSCKRPDETPVAAASIPKEVPEIYKKTAAERAAEKGFTVENNTGEKEHNCHMRVPEGIASKTLFINGSYCEGAEEYIPYSGCEDFSVNIGKIPESSEEYVYYFDDSVISPENWRADNTADSFINLGINSSSYSAFMEAFGEDGWIVIGRPVGAREGHIGYYSNGPVAEGFVVTDFVVDEVLYGTELPSTIRIREYYTYTNLRDEGNSLVCHQYHFALQNEFSFLLFLKKKENLPHYELFGNEGGLPLTEDYKNYDQEYLDHLARFLNRVPEEFNKFNRERLQVFDPEQSVYFNEHLVDQTGRDLKEALAANADDLIVALAQKYKIRIWPGTSRVYEETPLPFSKLAENGCAPDNKSSLPQP